MVKDASMISNNVIFFYCNQLKNVIFLLFLQLKNVMRYNGTA